MRPATPSLWTSSQIACALHWGVVSQRSALSLSSSARLRNRRGVSSRGSPPASRSRAAATALKVASELFLAQHQACMSRGAWTGCSLVI